MIRGNFGEQVLRKEGFPFFSDWNEVGKVQMFRRFDRKNCENQTMYRPERRNEERRNKD